jgi:hypothetical protein
VAKGGYAERDGWLRRGMCGYVERDGCLSGEGRVASGEGRVAMQRNWLLSWCHACSLKTAKRYTKNLKKQFKQFATYLLAQSLTLSSVERGKRTKLSVLSSS